MCYIVLKKIYESSFFIDESNKIDMKFLEVHLNIPSKESYVKDILTAQMAEIGFESFVDDADELIGYIQKESFNPSELQNLIDQFEYDKGITFRIEEAEDKDWNEEWEKNFFQPIIIGNECVIHSTFHKDYPKAKYDLLIDPKMAFGTGHHSTTSLMVRAILSTNLTGKSLLDMGCGTAILAILAAKRGASPITAIDIDEWAYNNAVENIRLNNEPQINVQCGGAELLNANSYDVILANINRNILLNDIHQYAKVLNTPGSLILSGFYESDICLIEEECNKYGLIKKSYEMDNNWVAVQFTKS